MTWSRTAPTMVNIGAYALVAPAGVVRIALLGGTYADLTPEDATSLGNYLLSLARKEDQ